MSIKQLVSAAVVSLMFSNVGLATLIGNDVSVGRTDATDTSNGANGTVFEVVSNHPVTSTGTITSFAIFDQVNDNLHGTFDAYVLRPTGSGNYLVVSDSGPLSGSGSGMTVYFPVTPISVQANDVIAEYGNGVPFSTDNSFPGVYYPSTAAPVAGTTITLPSTTYPTGAYPRDYALAANFTPVPEPASLILLACGLAGLLVATRRRRRA